MRFLKELAVVWVVSWATGVQYTAVKCEGKEPDAVVCAKQSFTRTERRFKSEEAAEAFLAVMQEMKATDAKLEKRDQ